MSWWRNLGHVTSCFLLTALCPQGPDRPGDLLWEGWPPRSCGLGRPLARAGGGSACAPGEQAAAEGGRRRGLLAGRKGRGAGRWALATCPGPVRWEQVTHHRTSLCPDRSPLVPLPPARGARWPTGARRGDGAVSFPGVSHPSQHQRPPVPCPSTFHIRGRTPRPGPARDQAPAKDCPRLRVHWPAARGHSLDPHWAANSHLGARGVSTGSPPGAPPRFRGQGWETRVLGAVRAQAHCFSACQESSDDNLTYLSGSWFPGKPRCL